MSRAKARYRAYFYLAKDDQLVRRVVSYREGKRYRVPRGMDPLTLVVELDKNGDHTRVHNQGPAFSDHLLRLAVLQEFGVQPSSTQADLGASVPTEVLAHIENQLNNIVNRVEHQISRSWDRLGGEADMVGVLVANLGFEAMVGDWAIDVRPQVFSAEVKEPHIGADIGWIVQVRTAKGERTTKALWMQAKKWNYDVVRSSDVFALADFERQFCDMSSRTTSAFGIVFTPDKIVVADRKQVLSLGRLLRSAVACERGDTREEVLAESVDRHFVMVADIEKRRRRPQKRDDSRRPDANQRDPTTIREGG